MEDDRIKLRPLVHESRTFRKTGEVVHPKINKSHQLKIRKLQEKKSLAKEWVEKRSAPLGPVRNAINNSLTVC